VDRRSCAVIHRILHVLISVYFAIIYSFPSIPILLYSLQAWESPRVLWKTPGRALVGRTATQVENRQRKIPYRELVKKGDLVAESNCTRRNFPTVGTRGHDRLGCC
jgi:hypothetical protein